MSRPAPSVPPVVTALARDVSPTSETIPCSDCGTEIQLSPEEGMSVAPPSSGLRRKGVLPPTPPDEPSGPALVRMLSSAPHRPAARLAVGAINDPLEREADRVANAVMQTRHVPDAVLQRATAPKIQRKCAACAQKDVLRRTSELLVQRQCNMPQDPEEGIFNFEDEEGTTAVQRRAAGSPTAEARPSVDVETQIRRRSGGGHSLPTHTRQFMETRMGVDLGDVRIHHDAEADTLARSLAATAFTVGRDVFFTRGSYQPGTWSGDHLLAHELAHTVQQGASAPSQVMAVQRVADSWEDRRRTWRRDGLANQPGTIIHHALQNALRPVNPGLVTEAPIPGSNRRNLGFNKVGYADLYKSSSHPGRIAGIRGYDPPGVDPYVVSMPGCSTSHLEHTRPCSPLNTKPGSGAPDPWDPPHLPTNIELGEIKPASASMLQRGGLAQISGYAAGYTDFVQQVHTLSGGATAPSATVGRIHSLDIPAGIDYSTFRTSSTNEGGAITYGDRRLWLWQGGGTGMYLYFDLARSLRAHSTPRWVRDGMQVVNELQEELRRTHGRANRFPLPKRDPKARPVEPTYAPADRSPPSASVGAAETPAALTPTEAPRPLSPAESREAHRSSESTTASPQAPETTSTPSAPGGRTSDLLIQRRAPRGARQPRGTNWRALGQQWEQRRGNFGRGIRRDMRRDRTGWADKIEMDRRLGARGDMADRQGNEQVRDLQKLIFWSGPKGRFVGQIRFRLGNVIERIMGLYDRMAGRMAELRRNVSDAPRARGGVGWRGTLIRTLTSAAKTAFASFIGAAYDLLAQCFDHAMDTAIDKFREEINDELAEEICELREKFDEFRLRLERDWGEAIQTMSGVISLLRDSQYWISTAMSLIDLIRLGVQVISCATPPALGCLWGLVAQIGIEVALDLVMGTQWFQNEVVQPVVRRLVDRYAGPPLLQLVNSALGPNLRDFHCPMPAAAGGGGLGGLSLDIAAGLDGAALRQHRDRWEQANRGQLMQVLQQQFQSSDGTPATPEQIDRLLSVIQGRSPQQLEDALARVERSDGTFDVTEAEAHFVYPTPPASEDLRSLDRSFEDADGQTESEEGSGPSEAGGAGERSEGDESGEAGPTPDAPTETGPSGDAGDGDRVRRPSPMPESWDSAPIGDFSYLILSGMSSGQRYRQGQVVRVRVSVEVPSGRMVPVDDVPMVYVRRRRHRGAVQFLIYFENNWTLPDENFGALGGPDHASWYTFGDGE